MTERQMIPLAQQLRLAAADLRREQPPAELLPRLQSRLAARHAPGRRSMPRWGWAAAGAFCVVVLATLLVLPGTGADASTDSTDGFVTLRTPTNGARMWLVPAEISNARLAALGLPFDPARPTERVAAQLLVDSSGEPVAVRVLE